MEPPLTSYEARQLVFCDPDFARDRIAMETLTGNRRSAVAMVRERRDPTLWISVRAESVTWEKPWRG